MSSVVPVATMMTLVAGTAAAALAQRSAAFGIRPLALTGSILFPLGTFSLAGCAVYANSMVAYGASSALVGGLGFYCLYPQIPPLLSAHWFPDRKGLAISLYFTSFGSGLFFASQAMQRLQAHFRKAPERLGGLDELTTRLTPSGDRVAQIGDEIVPVVMATQQDLTASGFETLLEGIYRIDGDCSNGAVPTMLCMGAVVSSMLQISAWNYRLPAAAAAAEAASSNSRVDVTRDSSAKGEPNDSAELESAGGGANPPPPLWGLTMSEAQRLPHFSLLAIGTFSLGCTGLPFLICGKFMVADIFGGADLPASTIAAASAGFPALLSMANLSGRFLWGPVSDYLKCGRTLTLFGASAPALALLPTTAAMVATDPTNALFLFKMSALSSLGIFAGAPVLLAPAVNELFGPKDAMAIYQRLWSTLPLSNFFASIAVTRIREHAYVREATALTEKLDGSVFVDAFGAPPEALPSLLESKAVTLPLLMRLAPPGTIDPSALLYNDAFYALAGMSTLAFVCNVAAFRLPLPKTASRVLLK
tara:strand:+ start:80 stop:1678 length:1599 start_codon:yes stop_codon:yes gene_type:complete